MPHVVKQIFELAVQHHQAGRLREAEQLYRQLLAVQPDHAEATHQLAIIAHQMGHGDAALALIRRAIELNYDFPDAHNNLGNALAENGKLDEAITSYRKALALRPDFSEAYFNLGNALRANGQLDAAITAYGDAILLRSEYAVAHNNLGATLQEQGRFEAAIAACRRAIDINPNLPEAHCNVGNALKGKGELDGAIAAYARAIQMLPSYAEAHGNLGNALQDIGLLDQAIAAYHRAIALRPDYAEAHSNLGTAMRDAGQLDDAIAAFRRAIALRPDYSQAGSNLIYTLHFHPAHTAHTIGAEHSTWNRQHAEPLRIFSKPIQNDCNPRRRLRVGYISPDFRDHVVGRNMLPLFLRHDRQQFEITCYAEVPRPDAMTSLFQQHSDHWRNTVGLSDEQVADQVRADQIDVLVDLALHMAHNRLLVFARKPAPVQVTFAGYPASTGLSAIDYRLSDPHLDPPGMDESIYSETTVRLPHSFWCYDPLDCADIPVNSLPALDLGFVTFGCLNNFSKVNDGTLSLWASVLRQVQHSRLVLLTHPGRHRQRATDLLAGVGVERERVEFISIQPRRQYLQQYHRIDLGLDSFPYNGHTTSLDSLWMGVPVVTLAGKTGVSRAGWSQLSNLGLRELAGETEEQFVRIAVDLAGDLPRQKALRTTLRQRMQQSPLMDAPKFARDVEAAFRQSWRASCEWSGYHDCQSEKPSTPQAE